MNNIKKLYAPAIMLLLILTTYALAQATGGIGGKVTDEKNAGIAGAHVILTSSSGIQLNTTTDQNGAFKFENLRSGSYFVEV